MPLFWVYTYLLAKEIDLFSSVLYTISLLLCTINALI
jgi:hypothetical protein